MWGGRGYWVLLFPQEQEHSRVRKIYWELWKEEASEKEYAIVNSLQPRSPSTV